MSAPSRLLLTALALVMVVAPPAWAGPPSDALRGHVERIFALLDDPTLKSVTLAVDRHRKLRALAEDAVDFREAAQRSLGAHWNERTPGERTHFVRLFTDLIDHGFLWRLSHDDERIVVDSESLTGKDALVKARAVSGEKAGGTPLLFSMHQGADGRWRIADVTFDGMSLVGMYSAQFAKVIRTSSYETLIDRLETKTRVEAQAAVRLRTESTSTNSP
jgi:phospholipid transport system substrate-binding protein